MAAPSRARAPGSLVSPDGDGWMAGEEGTGLHPPGPGALTGTLLGDNLVEPVTLEACPGCGLPRLLSPPAGIHMGVPAQREEDCGGVGSGQGRGGASPGAKIRAPPLPAPDLSYYKGTMAPEGLPWDVPTAQRAPDLLPWMPLGPRPSLSSPPAPSQCTQVKCRTPRRASW